MRVIRVLHWKAAEAAPLLASLRNAGFAVEYDEVFSTPLLRSWRQNPPFAFVIDLSRMPSQGREIAVALRQSPKTRHVPIVFCDGRPDKVETVRTLFPDAVFCSGSEVSAALNSVKEVEKPVRPVAMMDRYASRTAAQKLGMAEGAAVALIDPPGDVGAMLGKLPADVQFTEDAGAVTLCFVHDVDEARSKLSAVRKLAAKTKLWVLWRKKGSPGHTGVTENLIRDTGIDLGLVDYKICAVNQHWSALALARRAGPSRR